MTNESNNKELAVINAKKQLMEELKNELAQFSANVEYKMQEYEAIAPNIQEEVKRSRAIIKEAFQAAKDVEMRTDQLREDFKSPQEAITELKSYFDSNAETFSKRLDGLEQDNASLLKKNREQIELNEKQAETMRAAALALSPELSQELIESKKKLEKLYEAIFRVILHCESVSEESSGDLADLCEYIIGRLREEIWGEVDPGFAFC